MAQSALVLRSASISCAPAGDISLIGTLTIARHGDYDPNTGALDDDGIAGVHRLADGLSNRLMPPVIIVTSPIQRARETSELLASLLVGVEDVRQCSALG